MKNPILTEADYQANRDEAIRLFSPVFVKKYRNNPTAHKVVEMLTRNVSPYEILEQMIQQQEDNLKIVERAITHSTNPFGMYPPTH